MKTQKKLAHEIQTANKLKHYKNTEPYKVGLRPAHQPKFAAHHPKHINQNEE